MPAGRWHRGLRPCSLRRAEHRTQPRQPPGAARRAAPDLAPAGHRALRRAGRRGASQHERGAAHQRERTHAAARGRIASGRWRPRDHRELCARSGKRPSHGRSRTCRRGADAVTTARRADARCPRARVQWRRRPWIRCCRRRRFPTCSPTCSARAHCPSAMHNPSLWQCRRPHHHRRHRRALRLLWPRRCRRCLLPHLRLLHRLHRCHRHRHRR